MTEKEAILRDLKVIAILDKKINYSDRENIGAVLELNPKSLFSTEYGERYLKRIRQMYNGEEYDHTCILCGDRTEGDNPVCKNCYTMITIGAGRTPEAPKPLKTQEAPEPEQGEDESSVEEQQQAESVSEETEEADRSGETEEQPEIQPVESEAHPEESQQAEPEEPAAEAELESSETVESEEKSEEVPEEIEAVKPEESPEEEQIERLDDSEVPEEEIDDTAPEDIIEEAEKEETGEKESYNGPDFAADFSKKSRHLDLARALILLFVVVCFTIAIVCGMILILRDIRIKKQNSQVESRVVTDADLVDYYSIERNTYTYTVKDES